MSVTPGDTARRRLSGAERREQILDATKAIAFERGFHAVSIEVVAREAGISRPVVYNHFEDLPGLLEALIDRESTRALEQLAPVLPRSLEPGDAVEQMLAGLRGYLEVVEADPLTWRLVLMPPEGAPEILRERIAAGRNGVVALLADIFRAGEGPFGPSPDPELTARTFSALSDEGARLVLTDPEHFNAERIVEHARWLLAQLG
jgi:AcrR family transcriptional regulator